MTYSELKKQQREEFENFEIFFAFSNRQLEEGLESLGLKKNEQDKITHVGGGGYIKIENKGKMMDMAERHTKALENELEEETFFKDALTYELENHEYCITRDVDDALDALGLTRSKIDESKNQKEWMKEVLNKMN